MAEPLLDEAQRAELRDLLVKGQRRLGGSTNTPLSFDYVVLILDTLDAAEARSRSLVEALEAQYEVTERVMKAVAAGGPLGVELLSEWATATIAIREAALAADPAPREEGTNDAE